jgi:hypothetical protein
VRHWSVGVQELGCGGGVCAVSCRFPAVHSSIYAIIVEFVVVSDVSHISGGSECASNLFITGLVTGDRAVVVTRCNLNRLGI